MNIDVDEHVNAIRREVGGRILEAGEARVVTLGRTYRGPVEDVWDALTSQERLPRWFNPVSGDLRLGGRYQVENNASGTIEACDPPHSFAATWEYGGAMSWITVTLEGLDDDRTRFTLEHVAHVEEEFWDQYGPGAVGVGWDLSLVGLALHLETGGGREGAEEWAASEEGRRFMTLSSEAWRDAAVAGGLEVEWAKAAAERTTAFYTAA
jgi:uncharacterized protein YndB with AHSA1/START domain